MDNTFINNVFLIVMPKLTISIFKKNSLSLFIFHRCGLCKVWYIYRPCIWGVLVVPKPSQTSFIELILNVTKLHVHIATLSAGLRSNIKEERTVLAVLAAEFTRFSTFVFCSPFVHNRTSMIPEKWRNFLSDWTFL